MKISNILTLLLVALAISTASAGYTYNPVSKKCEMSLFQDNTGLFSCENGNNLVSGIDFTCDVNSNACPFGYTLDVSEWRCKKKIEGCDNYDARDGVCYQSMQGACNEGGTFTRLAGVFSETEFLCQVDPCPAGSHLSGGKCVSTRAVDYECPSLLDGWVQDPIECKQNEIKKWESDSDPKGREGPKCVEAYKFKRIPLQDYQVNSSLKEKLPLYFEWKKLGNNKCGKKVKVLRCPQDERDLQEGVKFKESLEDGAYYGKKYEGWDPKKKNSACYAPIKYAKNIWTESSELVPVTKSGTPDLYDKIRCYITERPRWWVTTSTAGGETKYTFHYRGGRYKCGLYEYTYGVGNYGNIKGMGSRYVAPYGNNTCYDTIITEKWDKTVSEDQYQHYREVFEKWFNENNSKNWDVGTKRKCTENIKVYYDFKWKETCPDGYEFNPLVSVTNLEDRKWDNRYRSIPYSAVNSKRCYWRSKTVEQYGGETRLEHGTYTIPEFIEKEEFWTVYGHKVCTIPGFHYEGGRCVMNVPGECPKQNQKRWSDGKCYYKADVSSISCPSGYTPNMMSGRCEMVPSCKDGNPFDPDTKSCTAQPLNTNCAEYHIEGYPFVCEEENICPDGSAPVKAGSFECLDFVDPANVEAVMQICGNPSNAKIGTLSLDKENKVCRYLSTKKGFMCNESLGYFAEEIDGSKKCVKRLTVSNIAGECPSDLIKENIVADFFKKNSGAWYDYSFDGVKSIVLVLNGEAKGDPFGAVEIKWNGQSSPVKLTGKFVDKTIEIPSSSFEIRWYNTEIGKTRVSVNMFSKKAYEKMAYDLNSGKCRLPKIDFACSEPYVFNPDTGECEAPLSYSECPEKLVPNKTTGKCYFPLDGLLTNPKGASCNDERTLCVRNGNIVTKYRCKSGIRPTLVNGIPKCVYDIVPDCPIAGNVVKSGNSYICSSNLNGRLTDTELKNIWNIDGEFFTSEVKCPSGIIGTFSVAANEIGVDFSKQITACISSVSGGTSNPCDSGQGYSMVRASDTEVVCEKQAICDSDGWYCLNDPIVQCPPGYKPDPEAPSTRCVAEGFCPPGYVEDENGTCKLTYNWSVYFCDAGYEGPIDKGGDCDGECGSDGCWCNAKNPPPNNCRKETEPPNSQYLTVDKMRPMEYHFIDGDTLAPEDYGKIKDLECGSNCLYYVYKITTDGDTICFKKKTGTEACYKVRNCYFKGEITVDDPTKHINGLELSDIHTLIPIGMGTGKIISSCQMNGHMGFPAYDGGIVSIDTGLPVKRYALLEINGTTKIDQDIHWQGFNIGTTAILLSDGNWYVSKYMYDENGNLVDRGLPDFVKTLDNSYYVPMPLLPKEEPEPYTKGGLASLPDAPADYSVNDGLDCTYNGKKLKEGTCLFSVKIFMPQPDLDVVAILDLESLKHKDPDLYKDLDIDIKVRPGYGVWKIYKKKGSIADEIKLDPTVVNFNSNEDYGVIDRLEFWNSFKDGFVGFLEFVRNVKDEDRADKSYQNNNLNEEIRKNTCPSGYGIGKVTNNNSICERIVSTDIDCPDGYTYDAKSNKCISSNVCSVGTYNPKTGKCSVKKIDMSIGRVGDNYLSGRCKIYHYSMKINVQDINQILSFKLKKTIFDDYIKISVNGNVVRVGPYGGDRLQIVTKNGSKKVQYDSSKYGSCELSTSWRQNHDIEAKHFLKNGLNEITIDVEVYGGGEAYSYFQAIGSGIECVSGYCKNRETLINIDRSCSEGGKLNNNGFCEVEPKCQNGRFMDFGNEYDLCVADIIVNSRIVGPIDAVKTEGDFTPENNLPYVMAENGYTSIYFDDEKHSTIMVNPHKQDKFCLPQYKVNVEAVLDPKFKFKLKVLGGYDPAGCTMVIGGIRTDFAGQMYSHKTEYYDGGKYEYKCSKYDCIGHQCGTATCKDGYYGNLVPDYKKDPGLCTAQECDLMEPFLDMCGKKVNCQEANPNNVFKDGKCYEYYCPEGVFQPEDKTCLVEKCPDGTTETNAGTCIKN